MQKYLNNPSTSCIYAYIHTYVNNCLTLAQCYGKTVGFRISHSTACLSNTALDGGICIFTNQCLCFELDALLKGELYHEFKNVFLWCLGWNPKSDTCWEVPCHYATSHSLTSDCWLRCLSLLNYGLLVVLHSMPCIYPPVMWLSWWDMNKHLFTPVGHWWQLATKSSLRLYCGCLQGCGWLKGTGNVILPAWSTAHKSCISGAPCMACTQQAAWLLGWWEHAHSNCHCSHNLGEGLCEA